MRALAEAWPQEFVQQPAARLPWGHLMVLLDKLSTRQERDWYAAAAGEYGWSRDVLVHQVETRLVERVGSAPSNFEPVAEGLAFEVLCAGQAPGGVVCCGVSATPDTSAAAACC